MARAARTRTRTHAPSRPALATRRVRDARRADRGRTAAQRSVRGPREPARKGRHGYDARFADCR
jgi:hypothetical protein